LLSRDQAFIQSQQVDRVGPLTVVVAHDLNNLLALIAGNLETLERIGNKNPMRRQVQAAPHAVHRGARLAQCSVHLAPGQQFDPVKADVNEVALTSRTYYRPAGWIRFMWCRAYATSYGRPMSTRTGKAAPGRKGSQLTGRSAGWSPPGIRYYPVRANLRRPLHPGSAQPTRWVLLRRLLGRRTSVHPPSASRPHLQE
jgi:hypothetical protein